MFFISYNQKVSCVGQKERYGVNSSKHQEYEVPNHTKRRSQVYNLSGPPLDIPHTSIQECPYVSWTPSRRLLPHRLVRPKRIKNSVHSKVDFIDDIKRGEQEVRRTLSLYLLSVLEIPECCLTQGPSSRWLQPLPLTTQQSPGLGSTSSRRTIGVRSTVEHL
jgi:hypothetical protein